MEKNALNKFFGTVIKAKEEAKNIQTKYTGDFGEELTNSYLHKTLNGNYKIVRNVCIPIGNKVTELDIVLLHEKGIFVIESKNYGGWIFGDEKSEKWCQTFPNGNKYFFYNPVKQNNTHCCALSKAINITEEKIKSYIVFSNRCSLKKVPKNDYKFTVCKRNELPIILNAELEDRKNMYNSNSLETIYNTLDYFTKEDQQKEHERQVKNFKEGNICPKCGRKLLVRKGAYNGDDFIGCSGYPNCKFSRNITDKDLELFGMKWDIQLFVGNNRIL